MNYNITWNVKPKVIPVIRGATGAISKSVRKYMNNMTGKTTSRHYSYR